MAAHLTRCPNCGAPMTPGRFARTATCGYCQAVVQVDEEAVLAARFREAHEAWRGLAHDPGAPYVDVGGDRWLLGPLVARGEVADVHYAERVRRPTERALVKLLRDPADLPLLRAEWAALGRLQRSEVKEAATLRSRVPQPIAHGKVSGGVHEGGHATVLRHAPGFHHTLEAVREVHAALDPRIGVWLWRRILETLGFLHASGVVHGAVLPPHLVVEEGEHGLRLVGYGCAGVPGAPLLAILERHERLYPRAQLEAPVLSSRHDLAQGAASVAFALGVDHAGRWPSVVPRELAKLVDDVAAGGRRAEADAWALWSEVGALARQLFGPPSFHPIVMPVAPEAR